MTVDYTAVAGVIDVQCPQGATFSMLATLLDESGLIDLTPYSALMQIRTTTTLSGGTAPPLVYSLSTADGQLQLGGTAGTVFVTISAANTYLIPPATYAYDLFIYDGYGYQAKMITGLFYVTPSVTFIS